MTEHFTCSTCNTTHEGLPTDYAWTLPDVVWDIPEAERATRAKFDNDLCQFGERFFIRCVLHVPFKEQPGDYGWGVWVEVSKATFVRYLKVYDHDATGEPAVAGKLANEMPAYPTTLGLPVQVRFGSSTRRPSVHVAGDSGHPLAVEQAEGMSSQRYHEILEMQRPKFVVGGRLD
jgi:hypothetical protein